LRTVTEEKYHPGPLCQSRVLEIPRQLQPFPEISTVCHVYVAVYPCVSLPRLLKRKYKYGDPALNGNVSPASRRVWYQQLRQTVRVTQSLAPSPQRFMIELEEGFMPFDARKPGQRSLLVVISNTEELTVDCRKVPHSVTANIFRLRQPPTHHDIPCTLSSRASMAINRGPTLEEHSHIQPSARA